MPVSPSPFHAGELDAQRRAGVADIAGQRGQCSIRDHMPDQHREFFAQLPFMLLAGVDRDGQPWPSFRVGEPGFVASPDERTLRIAGRELPGDPLHETWQSGAPVGGLGIELPTRRRNRVNGVITAIDRDALTLSVSQSFGNCPQYIQSRGPAFVELDVSMQSERRAKDLHDDDRAPLERADTFFIATAVAAQGVDVSHRGGMPGFVRVDSANMLTVPDYSGNNFFNTIGNLLLEPRVGLLFIDFDSGDLLYVGAQAEVVWDGPEVPAFRGARRLLRFYVKDVRRTANVLPFRWSPVQYSPKFRTDW
jgi:predicted pyridoxine 5'-phosphate oxidase superfamily flavin-nucleotide-binding protein